MPDRLFVDTVFVIALINRRDRYHQQALRVAQQFEGYPLLTTDAVLIEIGNALSRSYKVVQNLFRQRMGVSGLCVICGDAG